MFSMKADACPGLCWGPRVLKMAAGSSTTAEKRPLVPGVPDSLVRVMCTVMRCLRLGGMGTLGPTWNCCRSTAMKAFGLKSTARAIFNH